MGEKMVTLPRHIDNEAAKRIEEIVNNYVTNPDRMLFHDTGHSVYRAVLRAVLGDELKTTQLDVQIIVERIEERRGFPINADPS